MTTRKNLLERVEITSPCTASWDEMKGTDQIRYCSECHKYVYNLSEMTRREAEAHLVSRGNQMCARLTRDLEGQTLTVESLPPVRLLGWKPGPVASAVVTALISIAPAAAPLANGQVPSAATSSLYAAGDKAHRPSPGGTTSALTGIVSNEKGAALPGALVTLTSEASGEILSQLTSEEGEFRFDGLAARTYIVEIKANGYESVRHHDVNLQQGEARRVDVGMEKQIVTMGAMVIRAQPLRTLYIESDRVVVAEVGKSTNAEREGSSRLLRTSLSVTQTIKGDGHKPAIDVYHWAYGRGRGPLTEGETVLAFLQRKEDARADNGGYELIYGATSVRHISSADLATYLQRLEELKAIIKKPDHDPNDIVEWLVRCAEDPLTRRDGTFELNMSAWRELYEKEEADRRATAGEPLASPRKSPRDEEPIFAALLTSDQKRRLMTALLESEELGDDDFELIELATRWNDPRLLPFLISYLRRCGAAAPWPAQRVMQSVADLLDDDKVSALLRHYTNNASYEDLEVEEDVAADDAEDEDEDSSEAETTDTSDEIDTAPKLTPEAARQARVEMLKEFLLAVDAKMNLTPAK